MTTAQELSANDKRVLDAVDKACTKHDGFIPHGQADWIAVRRLCKIRLIGDIGFARCQDCENHEQLAFRRVEEEP